MCYFHNHKILLREIELTDKIRMYGRTSTASHEWNSE